MRLLHLYLGSWFPKTDLHLEELKNFLEDRSVIEGLDQVQAHTYHDALDPQDISLSATDGAEILDATTQGFHFQYIEDGLLMLSKKVEDAYHDMEQLTQFYHEKLSPALAYIYSTGAKGLEVIRTPGGERTIFLTAEGAKQKEIENFFSDCNKTLDTIESYDGFTVYADQNFLIVNFTKRISISEREKIVEYVIFFNEVKRHLVKLLQTHRNIWDEAEAMLSKTSIKNNELPYFNKQLTDYANLVANIESRIDQMLVNVEYRERIVNNYPTSVKQFSSLFSNVLQNMDYMKNLYIMTGRHLENNINNIATIYRENEERSLNKLQLLFLTTVITSFLALRQFPELEALLTLSLVAIVATAFIHYIFNKSLGRRVRIKKKQ